MLASAYVFYFTTTPSQISDTGILLYMYFRSRIPHLMLVVCGVYVVVAEPGGVGVRAVEVGRNRFLVSVSAPGPFFDGRVALVVSRRKDVLGARRSLRVERNAIIRTSSCKRCKW